MKNKFSIIKLFLVFVIPLFLFQNCSEETTEEVVVEEALEDNSKLLEILKQWGFEESDIEDRGDFYLVEGDIEFYKNKEYSLPPNKNLVSKNSSNSKILQTTTAYLVSHDVNHDFGISVAFASEVSQAWMSAVQSAMDEWNSICHVNLYITYDYDNADIQVYYKTSGAASAGFPTSDGKPGSWMKINDGGIGYYSALQKEWVIVHELGHALGLNHSYSYTDIVNGCSNISNIPGTPNCDFNSIMGYNTGGNTFSFSSYDVSASRYLFPDPPKPLLSGPTYMSSGINFITWTYDGGITNAQNYKWWYKKRNVNGAPYVIWTGQNLPFFVEPDTVYSSAKSSYFEIYLEVMDANGGVFTSNTYTILKKGKWKYTGL
ncbi:M57 family metalloprotease [Changchengzhania lutea]|uniref:M57 family metalloprotease n=1 Tax=Changchengzhania lutea TaxID=2049305 RepID=UPI00115F3993|nr:M57 family metalloprotease [Changchengzhania lutea]